MTNQQHDLAESLIRKSQYRPNQCPTCKNEPREVIVGHLDWYESTYRGVDDKEHVCQCDEQRALLRHYMLARIPVKYIRYTSADWKGDPQAMDAVEEYIEHWQSYREDGVGLGFYCKTQGTGKTFLATFIARMLIRIGESVSFTNFGDMISLYQMPYADRQPEIERLRESTILVLDEVVGPKSGAQADLFATEFESLIRYRSSFNKPTIFTTNLEPDDLEEIYPRVYSLLTENAEIIRTGQEITEDMRREIRDINREQRKKGWVKPIC